MSRIVITGAPGAGKTTLRTARRHDRETIHRARPVSFKRLLVGNHIFTLDEAAGAGHETARRLDACQKFSSIQILSVVRQSMIAR